MSQQRYKARATRQTRHWWNPVLGRNPLTDFSENQPKIQKMTMQKQDCRQHGQMQMLQLNLIPSPKWLSVFSESDVEEIVLKSN